MLADHPHNVTTLDLRNDCLFQGASPDFPVLVDRIVRQPKLWIIAGAKALRRISLHARSPAKFRLPSVYSFWFFSCSFAVA
jgi:hypothetical protein